MTTLLFANQAQTTLAAPVSSTATTIYIASGTASYFPNPGVDESFKLTLIDALNSLIEEIVLVTAVNGDVLTVIRGQEGTTPRAWKRGDFAANLMTAGTGNDFAQIYDLENTKYNAFFLNVDAQTGNIYAAPTQATSLVNKAYADSISQGTSKAECQCATTAPITLSGLQVIDQYTTVAGDRVVVKNQSNSAENGIWVVSTTAWARANDMSAWSQVPGASTFVQNGHLYANTGWNVIAPKLGTIDVTPIVWTQFSGMGTYTAGVGLNLIGTQFNISNTTVSAGSYGVANSVPTIVFNAQGQATSATNTPISIASSQINSAIPNSLLAHSSFTIGSTVVSLGDTITTLAGVSISGSTNTLTNIGNTSLINSSVTFNGVNVALGGSGTITAVAPHALTIGTGLDGGSYDGSAAVTINLANTAVTAGAYGSAGSVATFTVDAQGRLTLANTVSIAISNTQVSGLGTMSTQNANAVAITGGTMSAVSISLGSIDNTPIGATTANTLRGTTITATTGFTGSGANLTSIPNGALVNSSVTYNGVNVALGGSGTITAINPHALTIGTGLNGGSYDGSAAVTVALANTAVVAGTYGTDARSMTLVVNAQGQITSLIDQPISIAASQINTTIPNSGLTNSTISGVSLGSNLFSLTIGTGLNGSSYNGSGAVTIALANTTVTAGSYGSASKSLSATVDAQGRLTSLSAQNIAIATAQITDAGQPFGAATLDASGTLTASQIPASLLGALKYQGTWNAATNTPTLTSSVGTQGYYYVVNVAGTTNLNGITDWQVNDWAIFNGSVWQKIDNTDLVTSVNGYTGSVVLSYTDVGAASSAITISAGTGLSGGGNLTANRTLSIANTAVVAGSYGTASQTLQATVNAQGQLTALSAVSIAIANTQVSGLGTMSTQNANAVAITGGNIDGTVLGGTTAAAAHVTTLSASGLASFAASTSGYASINIPSGAEPTAPIAGDVWTKTTGLYYKNTAGNIEQLDIGANTPGVLSQPTITITGSGATFNASSVNAVLFSLPGWTGDFRTYVIPAATGLALVDNSANYLVVSYNSGSPVYSVVQNVALIDNSSIVGATLLWRNGTQVHYQPIDWGRSTASRLNRRLVQTNRYQWASGLALGESTGNVITVGAGVVWYGVTQYNETLQTSASSNADFYYHVGGVWNTATVSTYNITQYDDGTALQTLNNGRYAVNWVYRYIDGSGLPKLAYVLGGGNYTLAQAQTSLSPTPPPILSTMAILVGRIIVLKNAATAIQIDSAFTQVFTGSTVTLHNDLGGLQGGTANEFFHLTNAEYTGTGTGTFVRASSPTLVTPNLGTPSSLTLTNATGLPNAGLLNSSVTFNGVAVSLGGSGTITATATNALTIGTGLTGTSYNGSTAVTIAIDSTVATLAGAQTLTNKSISGSTNTLTNIPNSALVNSSITIGSSSVSLGNTLSTLAGVSISGLANTITSIGNSSLVNSSVTIGSSSLSLGGTLSALAGVTISGATNTLTNIGNSSLINSSITINGSLVSLGGSVTVTAIATNALTIDASGAGVAPGSTYNGSAATTISYNTVGADAAGTAVALAIALG